MATQVPEKFYNHYAGINVRVKRFLYMKFLLEVNRAVIFLCGCGIAPVMAGTRIFPMLLRSRLLFRPSELYTLYLIFS